MLVVIPMLQLVIRVLKDITNRKQAKDRGK